MKLFYISGGGRKPLSLRSKLFTVVILAATFASCNNEEEVINQRQGQPLQLNVRTAELSSRGIETSTSLSSGKTIGIRLAEEGKTTYDNITYDNIPYTTDGTAWAVTQQGYSEPLLSATEGTVYAYYPWSDKVDDLSQVPVETESQTDYMYAEPATGCNAEQTQAELTLKHALSVVRLSFAKGSYTGEGSVTRIAVKGSNIATIATMDATDGSLSGYAGTDTGLAMDVTLDVDDSPQQDFIIVPVTSRKDSPVLTVTMDGEDYSVTLPEVTFVQGCIHTYTVTVNNKQLVISDVTVGEWGYNTQGQPVVKVNGKTVTFTGNIEGIAFHNSVTDDGTLTVKAVPVEDGKEVADVTFTGSATLDQQLDSESGVLTVTLANVTADQQIDFNGTWYQVRLAGDMTGMTFKRSRATNGTVTVTATPDDSDDVVKEATGEGLATLTQTVNETTGVRTFTIASQTSAYTLNLNGIGSTWLVATYNITTTGEQDVLCTTESSYAIGSVSRMKVDEMEVTPSYTYNFTTTGEHVIKYKLSNTKIPNFMFYKLKTLIDIIIPENINVIDMYAFAYCTGLTGELVIPNSVTTIGNGVFDNCMGLTGTLKIPDSVISIGQSAFHNCYSLTALDLGQSLETIERNAFGSCKGLTGEIIFPNSLKYIGNNAFGNYYPMSDGGTYSCININKITFGESDNLVIGSGAFYGCTGIKYVNLGIGVKSIGKQAFYDCTGLTNLDLGTGVQTIGEKAFNGCSNMSGTIIIPNSVTTIGDGAFGWCERLTGTLIIPNSVTSIGSSAFYMCKGLTGLKIGTGVQTIGSSAFSRCTGLKGELVIPNSVISIGSNAFYYRPGMYSNSYRCKFTSIVFGESLTSIGDDAFCFLPLSKITCYAITAPTLGQNPFYGVNNSGTLIVPAGATGYDEWMSTDNYYLGYYNWTKTESSNL